MAYVVQLQAGKWHSNAARCSMEFDGKPRNNKKEETMRVEKYILASCLCYLSTSSTQKCAKFIQFQCSARYIAAFDDKFTQTKQCAAFA